MDLICNNEKCQHRVENIDVLAGWSDSKMKVTLAGFGGDRAKLMEHQEAAIERNTVCPDCGNKMSRFDSK